MPEIRICQNCGARASSGMYTIFDDTFICLSCYLASLVLVNNNTGVCRHCVITVEAGLDHGDNLCPDCTANCCVCDICDNEFFDEARVDDDGNTWCPTCFLNSFRCNWCGTRELVDDLIWDNCDTGLCRGCQEDAFICDSCGRWCRLEDCSYDNVCCDCDTYDNDDEDDDDEDDDIDIYSHDYKPCPNFLPFVKSEALYLGVELETDNYDSRSNAVVALNNLANNQYYLKEDGSLHCGFEIVTHPATLEYHQKTMPWSKISEIVTVNGGRSHDTITCGLHVHFNKDYYGDDTDEIDYHTMKLLYLFERHWDNLVKFSRRRESELNAWARRYHVNCDALTQRKAGVELVKECKCRGRYYSVNLENTFTIEIRIFKGTLKVETLLACIELTAFLVEFARKHRPNYLHRLSWYDLTNKIKAKTYPNLYKYIQDMRRGTQNNDEIIITNETTIANDDRRPLIVGDRVSVRPEIIDPIYTWGDATHASIGVIMHIDDDTHIHVDFPEHTDWLGIRSELVRR